MELGFGSYPPQQGERERERERRERERETPGYEPFALHAPMHWAI